jgi:membrane protease YdiL (CAAX protease family)
METSHAEVPYSLVMQQLKSVGKFLLFFILALGLQGVVQVAIIKSHLYTPANGWNALDFTLSDGIGFLAALAITALFARFERRRVGEYGLPLRPTAPSQVIEGFAWGAAAVTLAVVAVVGLGGATWNGLALHGPALVRSGVMWLLAMLVLGFFEEMMFRGYALDVLTGGFGFAVSAIVNAVLFGALHYFTKPMENVADAAAVALLTLFLCMTIRRTGALWFAIGFHAAFDYFALVVYGSPNTGNDGKPLAEHLLDVRYPGPAWLTGGPRGLEASVPMFGVVALLFVLYAMRTRKRTS